MSRSAFPGAYSIRAHEFSAAPAHARIVLALPSGPRLAQLLGECLDRELVAVPLGPRTEPRRIAEIADRVGAAFVVTDDGVEATGAHSDRPEADGLALIMFTSGSTGAPKGVMLPRDSVFANARKTAALHHFGPDRPHATCLPLFHCNALVMSLIGTRLTDTPLVVHTRFEPEGYFADIARRGVRTASIVPALIPDLLEVAPAWPECLDYLITAAAPLTADLARAFHDRYGPRIRQGYGLTELMNFSFTAPEFGPDEWRAQYLDEYPPVGVALPGTEIRLEAGEVWLRSDDRMRGYWDDPQSTAAALTDDNWLRTGDLGRMRGDLLVLDGRLTERIDRGGEKFYPLDIERTWRDAGLRGTFAAVPVPDEVLGHEIGLVTADASPDSIAAVRRIVERGPMRPGAVSIGGYSATATGKPQRGAMGRRLTGGRVSATRLARSAGAARTPTAEHAALADRVARCLDVDVEEIVRLDLFGDTSDADPRTHLGAADTDRPVVVVHGADEEHGLNRWDLVAVLRELGHTHVGVALLRSGATDLGGVVWSLPH